MKSVSSVRFLLQGLSDRNPLSEEFKREVLKHLPIMRKYKLDDAANYLEAWISGTLPLQPLLDISARLA